MALSIQYDRELHELAAGFGLSETEMAGALGTTSRTVRRWLAGATPAPGSRARIEDAFRILELLKTSVEPGSIPKWARRRVDMLNGARPADLLAQGKLEPLIGLAEGLACGSFS